MMPITTHMKPWQGSWEIKFRKKDSKDDDNAVAENVANLLRIDALNNDAYAHHHAREALKRDLRDQIQ